VVVVSGGHRSGAQGALDQGLDAGAEGLEGETLVLGLDLELRQPTASSALRSSG